MSKVSNTNNGNKKKNSLTKNSTPKNNNSNIFQAVGGFNIEIKKSARKTICLQVKRDGSVCVLAPSRAKNEAIEQFVLSKKEWLLKATEKVQSKIKQKPIIIEGASVSIMGRLIEVWKLDPSASENYHFEGDRLLLKRVEGSEFEGALKDIVTNYMYEKIFYYANLLGVNPSKISIKAQKSRWGSCNSKGEITFNWRLIFAPEDVIDYVIVHELCHLIHMNHSKEFWDTVYSILPDYKTRRDWLKKEGGFIDWSFND